MDVLPLRITPRQSGLFFLYIVFVHACALMSLLLIAVPVWALFLFTFIINGSFLYHLKKYCLQASVYTLHYDEAQQWRIEWQNTVENISLSGSTFISGFLILLHYIDDDQGEGTLIIFRDALSANEFRRLRALLTINLSST